MSNDWNTIFVTGYFNAQPQFWWPHTTPEGTEIEELFTKLGSQHISETTTFDLDSYCHQQIVYCEVNFKIEQTQLLLQEA